MNHWLFQERWGHPRPDKARPQWLDLTGEWSFDLDPWRKGLGRGWQHNPGLLKKHIQVPFPVESPLSGVETHPGLSAFWYGRWMAPPTGWQGRGRVLLHFGAVDATTQVFLNGVSLGSHTGGFSPFSFDITRHLQPGANALCLLVSDLPDPRLARGKQSLLNQGVLVFYPPTSGVWQPVWLEKVGEIYAERYTSHWSAREGALSLGVTLAGGAGRCVLTAHLTQPGGEVLKTSLTVHKKQDRMTVDLPPLPLPHPALWSTDSPHLYPLRFTVTGAGEADELFGYIGLRTIEARGDRIFLNNAELFQQMALCQGYFEGGLCTPPNGAEDFWRDVSVSKDLGFNGLRMHAKAEDPRFHAAADALGLLLWAEMPSAYLPCKPQRENLLREWRTLLDRDRGHPSIITWVPVNESWGAPLVSFDTTQREFVEELYHFTKTQDPTRLVVDNSGFEHTTTDVLDLHHYLATPAQARDYYQRLKDPGQLVANFKDQIFRPLPGLGVVSAYAPGFAWRGEPMIISEYGGWPYYPSLPGLTGGMEAVFRDYTLDIARAGHLRGYCYTQLYDTHQEDNGLLDIHRQPKIPAAAIRWVNDEARRIYF